MKLWPTRRSQSDEVAPLTLKSELTWPFNTDSGILENFEPSDQPLSVMLVDMTGLDWSEIEPLLPVAKDASAQRVMVPVLVVDLTDFVKLRQLDMAYDVLPNAAANAALHDELDWASYLTRRRLLLLEKWQPGAIVHLSGRPEDWE